MGKNGFTKVQVGQVYECMAKNTRGRQFRVIEILGRKAKCKLTWYPPEKQGEVYQRTFHIKLDSLAKKPWVYRLLGDNSKIKEPKAPPKKNPPKKEPLLTSNHGQWRAEESTVYEDTTPVAFARNPEMAKLIAQAHNVMCMIKNIKI